MMKRNLCNFAGYNFHMMSCKSFSPTVFIQSEIAVRGPYNKEFIR